MAWKKSAFRICEAFAQVLGQKLSCANFEIWMRLTCEHKVYFCVVSESGRAHIGAKTGIGAKLRFEALVSIIDKSLRSLYNRREQRQS
jgi:hypothetical protein